MLLPQVAEAVGAIALIYFTVKRWLGATPGLLAAAGLAVTPIVAALAHSEISDTLLMLLLTAAAYTTPAVWAASTTQAAYSGNAHGPTAGAASSSHGGADGSGRGGPSGGSSFDAATNLATVKSSGAGSTYDVAVIGYSAASEYITAGARTLFIGGYSGDADNVSLEECQQMVADSEVTYIHLGGGGCGSLGVSGESAAEEISQWVQENFTEVSDGLYALTRSTTTATTAP